MSSTEVGGRDDFAAGGRGELYRGGFDGAGHVQVILVVDHVGVGGAAASPARRCRVLQLAIAGSRALAASRASVVLLQASFLVVPASAAAAHRLPVQSTCSTHTTHTHTCARDSD